MAAAAARRVQHTTTPSALGSSSADPPHSVQLPTDALFPVSGSGVNTNFRDTVQYVDKHELVLAIGKYAVLQNIPQQELAFLTEQHRGSCLSGNGNGALGEITAMALCGKRHYLALCRAAVHDDGINSDSTATVSIYSVSASAHTGTRHVSKRSHDSAPLESHESKQARGVFRVTLSFDTERFCGVALSHDGKLVCCQAANASWTLVVWDWLRSRQVALVDVHCKVTRVRFNTVDMAQLSTSGGNVLRLWTMSEYTLRIFSSFKSGDETKSKHVAHYVEHVWLPGDTLVALLDDGDVQLIVNAELKQTLRGVHGHARMTCMCALSNGEGVALGGTQGLVSIVRIGSTMVMKSAEKEMQLQRRMRVAGAHTIVSLATDPAAATLVCCTESGYGAYDLSDLCFLRGDDDIISLAPLASTPVSTAMQRLSASSRRPCFAALCTLPCGAHAVNVWSLLDAHKCVVAHSLADQPPPLCVDLHPSGYELVVAFSSKVHVYVVLQDALALAFELPQKQLNVVQYSQTGSIFVGVHAMNKLVYVYQSYTRHAREPQLVGTYRDFRDTISAFMWSLHDSSFFGADVAGELRHCRVRSHCGGEIEDFVVTESSCRVQTRGNTLASLKTWRLDHHSHDFVLFAIETPSGSTGADAGATTGIGAGVRLRGKCVLRAWINGDLTRDAIKSPGASSSAAAVATPTLGESLPHDVTVLGVGCANLLFAGTATGAVVILGWKLGKRNAEGHQTIRLLPHSRRVDLHTAPVCGVFYAKATRTLVTNATNGVVLACALRQDGTASVSGGAGASDLAIHDDDYIDPAMTFSSVAQADEVALASRSKLDLRKLKLMEIEAEAQQLRLENEMLTKQIGEQRAKYEDSMASALGAAADGAAAARRRLQAESDARLHSITCERDAQLQGISGDARIAQDQYLQSLDRLQRELASVRDKLYAAEIAAQDDRLVAEERETQLRDQYDARIESLTQQHGASVSALQRELELTRRQLHEVLRQTDEDELAHLALLSTSIEGEKNRAAHAMTAAQGTLAGLHQELKMLLAALNDKDAAIESINAESRDRAAQVALLQDRLNDAHRSVERVVREKADTTQALAELQHTYDGLERLNNVHRSQIELLQRQLLPKDRELAQMQQYLDQLHGVNQDVVVQANLSDRLRSESAAAAKRLDRDVASAHRRLETVRHSIVVVHEELGELVTRSAVQEKSAIVSDVVRIHKRLARQLDALQARDESAEEITAELHRQNDFLLRTKQHLRQQMDGAAKDKHKLVSALSFQNGTLLAELNTFKRQNKELERRAKRLEERERERERRVGARNLGAGSSLLKPSSEELHSDGDGKNVGIYDGNQDPRESGAVEAHVSVPTSRDPSASIQMTARASASRVLARPQSAGALPTRRHLASSTTTRRSRVL